MKIKDANLVISAVKPDQYPGESLPELALAGRSNVGKSSLINKLIGRKKLAHTSSKPGKTRTLNFYRIQGEKGDLFFVDLPGYGFAKVSKQMKEQWGEMIESYLSRRESLEAVIQVVDLRHPPSKDDIQMYDWLKHFDIPVIVAATKADKVPRGKWQKHVKIIKEQLEMEAGDELVIFSAETGNGKDELWKAIFNVIKA
ncbi:MAG: YihA family ribosome biogenesis GTP-binding protein [Bacillaceae bacterium]|nr:YihA family ribosome biogenesis GTP-binding protein [Bacillaceae bacterium]